ncbi:isocitrate/isopropylmalate dehydrogenase family protein [Paraburkholderia sp. Ac-20336]|uniref:isocitrate/isopropylmalate dehydrogenase family protein n=1 Tax=unclassified Paraburkholderia TaxID=2615204 RepID=UPI00141ED368|nr:MULTISPECIES: isocitrate/isopropylmalate dehydrogenase family protein [unclassified Paraburkholderia]MBN3802830.1 isocitrate/isopropylmalate dehydrogenase family protein [Paraburkholderia sp. Ac-20336]MBN3847538.1 isocitrate/isopropylmalate dehydrogenase family protein [Paraburkholderia sp. Ac-20342]NIF79600.1 isocitrate/isopropylmalate dehydrogenase family protein [Paraburkholderia sp. Cy-641]
MSNSRHIAILPGDGIGEEVMAAACHVLGEVGKKIGVAFELDSQPAGAQHYLASGVALPDETLAVCDRADAILFGAMGLPHVRGKDGTEVIPQLDLRFHFDLYAGVRPVKTFGGLPLPLAHPRSREIDLVLVRENTEGLFYARGRGDVKRDENGQKVEVFDTMRITRQGTERICEFAFALAEQRAAQNGRASRVTNVDKANVFESMAFFREVFESVAARHAGVATDSAYVDAVALNLVLKPWTFDVLVTENMFGDILSDLIAGLVGGMGMAPSADIGDKHGLFQPAHGTAPDIAGQGKANPTAMILSAAMMLQWLAVRQGDQRLADGAALIEAAVEKTFSGGKILPFEFGGSHGTKAITDEVVSFLTA